MSNGTLVVSDGKTIRFLKDVPGYHAGQVATLSSSVAQKYLQKETPDSTPAAELIVEQGIPDGVKIRFTRTVPGHSAGDVVTVSPSRAKKFLHGEKEHPSEAFRTTSAVEV